MRIGILKCGQSPEVIRDELGDYDTMFERLLAGRGFTFRSWHVEAMDFPASVHEADGWLLTGSRHGVYEDHAFIPPLEAFIRDAYASHVPLVGICFGHQIIAQALGGTVIKSPKGWAVGAQDYDFGGEKITLNAWHQDQVVVLPKDATVLGHNEFCENAALVYNDRAFTVQAHPEFPDRFIQGLIDHRAKGVVPPELVAEAETHMGEPRQSGVLADRIEAFFKAPRQALTSEKGAA
ncbi:type 1 glutamine amidotransferase [Paracoccus aminophilus]|uniref:GMP synthase (Glutamine-hydrolyzing) n=1 Tax=Paracoccus aminophilus JCM 7686 TaxID=1367847 RepID=S5YV47_PARAH|nr:type 1 glutamine amidotransferase [Paracoccus aminophilus]AGT09046.1 GMP synthase (glutamine-hydrolyzing) [Paracoccus aminophilus JCM 7686]